MLDYRNTTTSATYPPLHKPQQGLKPNYEQILRDPAELLLTTIIASTTPRIDKFHSILSAPTIDITALRKLAWNGVPSTLRPIVWQLLLGYLPIASARRIETLDRKRKEYLQALNQAYARGPAGLDQAIHHQICIDVPRTNPTIPLYGSASAQRALEQVLYVWAIRHPASGYVQGINDLVTPFFQVFLSAYLLDEDVEAFDFESVPQRVADAVCADAFWCLSKLLDGIQDHYVFAQPGIHRQVLMLRDLVQRIDAPLAQHIAQHGIEFIQFSFRWMNCLLMRELPMRNTIRMWDTYLAEGQTGFSDFHIYVCAAFLQRWSGRIQAMDFQAIMMFLQALPTQDWTEKDIELLLSEAYMWQSLFADATAHLK